MTARKQDPLTIIYIALEVRSGSTLVDHLLSNHPEISSIGEIRNIYSFLHHGRDGSGVGWNCTCGQDLDNCPVWSRSREIYQQLTGSLFGGTNLKIGYSQRSRLYHLWMLLAIFIPLPSWKKWLLSKAYQVDKILHVGLETLDITRSFAQSVENSILVDSSKRASQLYAILQANTDAEDIKVVHLVRDGRAVIYSKITRAEQFQDSGEKFELFSAIRAWVYNNLKIQAVMRLLPAQNSIRIRYEDLCRDPEKIIQQICSQREIPLDGRMVRISGEEKHNIGGSPHRFQ